MSSFPFQRIRDRLRPTKVRAELRFWRNRGEVEGLVVFTSIRASPERTAPSENVCKAQPRRGRPIARIARPEECLGSRSPASQNQRRVRTATVHDDRAR
jgi:hypothetical protein